MLDAFQGVPEAPGGSKGFQKAPRASRGLQGLWELQGLQGFWEPWGGAKGFNTKKTKLVAKSNPRS